MTILELNEVFLGRTDLYKDCKEQEYGDYSAIIDSIITEADGLYNNGHFKSTKSIQEFYKANPILDSYIDITYRDMKPSIIKQEFFYSVLCGLYIPNVPSKLLALFYFAKESVETPNKMVAALDKEKISAFIKSPYGNDPLMFKKLIDTLWGYDVQLLTKEISIVTNNGVTEIYISNIDDVLLCNEDVREVIKDTEDINNLKYDKTKGVVISGDNDLPLRTLMQAYGLVVNDLDLRGAALDKPQRDI